jgi:hypothetical protein
MAAQSSLALLQKIFTTQDNSLSRVTGMRRCDGTWVNAPPIPAACSFQSNACRDARARAKYPPILAADCLRQRLDATYKR